MNILICLLILCLVSTCIGQYPTPSYSEKNYLIVITYYNDSACLKPMARVNLYNQYYYPKIGTFWNNSCTTISNLTSIKLNENGLYYKYNNTHCLGIYENGLIANNPINNRQCFITIGNNDINLSYYGIPSGPFYTFQSIYTIYGESCPGYGNFIFFITTVGSMVIIGLIIVLPFVVLRIKQYILERRVARNMLKNKPLESQPLINHSEEDNICTVCLDVQKDCILHPCKHMCCCYNCYILLNNNKCPVCRKVITNIQLFELINN